MKKYQYQLVRYIHDRATLEFVNVGIILFEPDSKFLKSQFINRFGRISQFFSDVSGHYLLATLRNFEKEINIISKRGQELFFPYKNISEITNTILPKDDSALVCSEVFYGLDVNIDSALSDLYNRLVNKYQLDEGPDNLDDKYVWKNVYKKYFDKYNITHNLRSFSIRTPHDTIQFDRAWKNGTWHCYQALSFDLKRIESIKNKVYKWSGILNELSNSKEDLYIHFLTVGPSRYKNIQEFINDTFIQRGPSSIKVSLIKENEADKFVSSIKKEMSMNEIE
jgi:hypothetical protein